MHTLAPLLVVVVCQGFRSPVQKAVKTRMRAISTVEPKFGPMPEAIRSDVPGTWAHDTMSRRVIEEILDKVVYGDNEDAAWFVAAKPALDALRSEVLSSAELSPIPDDGGDDVVAWNELLAAETGSTWLTAPWLLSEFYLYRRVAAATGWFEAGDRPDQGRPSGDCFSPFSRAS